MTSFCSFHRSPRRTHQRSPRRSRALLAWALPLCTALATSALPTLTHAQNADAQALRTRALAATCAQCHGTDGQAVSGAAVPGLAGLPAPYFTEQMAAFKAGTRPATVMHQLAKGYTDAQIATLAAYFAASSK
jgi:cytochrome subunit of sulfide dehydrogenase